MFNQIVWSGLALIFMMFFACAPKTTAPLPDAKKTAEPITAPAVKTGWEGDWEKTLEAAKKEGKVVIKANISSQERELIINRMKKLYGLDADVVVGRATELATRMLTEYRSGIYIDDINIGSVRTSRYDLKPAGLLKSMYPLLILPEVKDPKAWYEGKLTFHDEDGTVFYASLYPSTVAAINTTLVTTREVLSYSDFLNPKWEGKIILPDPTIAGAGASFGVVTGSQILNWDYLKALVKQKPLISRDRRMEIDWLSKGKYLIAIVPSREIATEFIEAGAPIKFIIPKEGTWLTTGSATISVLSKSPHPNAAKVFLNWYLSREGQVMMSRMSQQQSTRVDIPTDFLDSERIRVPQMKYPGENYTEGFYATREKYEKMARDIFTPLLK